MNDDGKKSRNTACLYGVANLGDHFAALCLGYEARLQPPRVRNFVTRIAVEMHNVFEISTALH